MILRECEILVTSVQFSSVQLWQTLCDPMDCSTPGFHVPSPTPRIYSNSYPLSWWCCPTISSSVIPFSSCLQSFPASGSFQMSQLFTLGGQSIGFSFNISPSNEYLGLISLGWTGWITMLSKGLSRVFSNTTVQKESVQYSSVTQLCLPLCDPMNCRLPGLPVHH